MEYVRRSGGCRQFIENKQDKEKQMNSLHIKCPACRVTNRIPVDRLEMKPRCGSCGETFFPLSSGAVVELDDTIFDRVTGNSSLPVMVDFFSPSCGPCRMLSPVIDSLAAAYAGKVVIAKYDTSRWQMSASRFQIKGVPTMIFFRQGRPVDQLVGAAPQGEIEQRLNSLLS